MPNQQIDGLKINDVVYDFTLSSSTTLTISTISTTASAYFAGTSIKALTNTNQLLISTTSGSPGFKFTKTSSASTIDVYSDEYIVHDTAGGYNITINNTISDKATINISATDISGLNNGNLGIGPKIKLNGRYASIETGTLNTYTSYGLEKITYTPVVNGSPIEVNLKLPNITAAGTYSLATTDITLYTLNNTQYNLGSGGKPSFWAPTYQPGTTDNKRYILGSSSTTNINTVSTNNNCYMQSGVLYSKDRKTTNLMVGSSTTSVYNNSQMSTLRFSLSGGILYIWAGND